MPDPNPPTRRQRRTADDLAPGGKGPPESGRDPLASERPPRTGHDPLASERPPRTGRHMLARKRRTTPDLDYWLPDPSLRVAHRRESGVPPERLWEAARSIRLSDTRLLGRLVRWRIPGLPANLAFDELFRAPPFMVLAEEDAPALVSGLVGRIWTLRRDYPELSGPEEFRRWSVPGTARVVFANWIDTSSSERSAICAEVRVDAIGAQGRVGVAAVRPLVGAFGHLVGSDGIELAAKRADQSS
jgi:hypothetical protein